MRNLFQPKGLIPSCRSFGGPHVSGGWGQRQKWVWQQMWQKPAMQESAPYASPSSIQENNRHGGIMVWGESKGPNREAWRATFGGHLGSSPLNYCKLLVTVRIDGADHFLSVFASLYFISPFCSVAAWIWKLFIYLFILNSPQGFKCILKCVSSQNAHLSMLFTSIHAFLKIFNIKCRLYDFCYKNCNTKCAKLKSGSLYGPFSQSGKYKLGQLT